MTLCVDWSTEMSEYEFTLVLAAPEESEEDASRLHEAGCSDGSISTSGGVTRIDFHRKASSLEEAILAASADVRSAGFEVDKGRIDPRSLTEPRETGSPRRPGSAVGKLTIIEDDDAHLDDFKEHMP